MRDLRKFRGCLIGGAVGDALGYPVEFMTDAEIRRACGQQGITAYRLQRGKALISDDTQMSLFTAAGLLFGETRGKLGKPCGPASYLDKAYRDWLATQDHGYPYKPDFMPVTWLLNVPELFSRRAPGNTCLSALKSGRIGSVGHPINKSKGCGGVMRVAPIGIYLSGKAFWTQEEIDMAGAEAAAITHGHELGYIPAAALVHIISRLASGEARDLAGAVGSSLEAMKELFPHAGHMGEFLRIMDKAVKLSGEGADDAKAIEELGGGWVAEETLAISVYCALKYSDDFEKAVIASVNHSGDSDSTGAVTGNIMGTLLGFDAIPERFLENLELKDIILELAGDLYHDCQMEERSDYRDELWEHKYLYMDYVPAERQRQ